VAGRRLDDGLAAVATLQDAGCTVVLDYLGEAVRSADEARAAAAEIHRAIAWLRPPHAVAIKPTQLGLALDEELAAELLDGICAASSVAVTVDAEQAAYRERTVRLVGAVAARRRNLGAVVQANHRASRETLAAYAASGVPVRLCKGAYAEDDAIAFARPSEVDARYLELVDDALSAGLPFAAATHDDRIQAQVRRRVAARPTTPPSPRPHDAYFPLFEFQMLYGVRRPLQRDLVAAGYPLRVYVPYGAAFYPYLARRIAERPRNGLFVLRAVLGA
jgi:proline dehydrogenase